MSYYYKKSVTVGLLMTTFVVLAARTPLSTNETKAFEEETTTTVVISEKSNKKISVNLPAKAAKAESQPVDTFTVKVDFDHLYDDPENSYSPQSILLYSPTEYFVARQKDRESVVGEARVPAGKYCLLASFTVGNDDSFEMMPGVVMHNVTPRNSAFIIVDDIEISSDDMLMIDPTEATNKISATTFNADGEEHRVSSVSYDEFFEETETEGNCTSLTQRVSIYSPVYGDMLGMTVSASKDYIYDPSFGMSEPTFADMSTVYVNPTESDVWISIQRAAQYADRAPEVIDMIKKGVEPATLDNKNGLYVAVGELMRQSELGKTSKYPTADRPFTLSTRHFIEGKEIDGLSLRMDTITGISYCPSASMSVMPDHKLAATMRYDDYVWYYKCDTLVLGGREYYTVTHRMSYQTSPDVVFDNDGNVKIANRTADLFYTMADAPSDPTKAMPEALSFSSTQMKHLMGATPTYYSLTTYSSIAGDDVATFVPVDMFALGYQGETNATQTRFMTHSVKFNGQPLEFDNEYYAEFGKRGLQGWMMDRNAEKPAAGAYEFATTSCQLIDGLNGVTRYELSFDQTKADNVAPAVQYIQFRDSEGFVNHTFATSNEGKLLIGAGDFSTDNEGQLTNAGEAIIKVTYAPFASDKWTELQLTKIADAQGIFSPIYEATLAKVTGVAEKGWYDLKVELADASGNKTMQVVSPAFKVATPAATDVASVGTLIVDGDTVIAPSKTDAIDVFNMQGVKMAAGVGSCSIASLPSGIYIIKSGSASMKTVR